MQKIWRRLLALVFLLTSLGGTAAGTDTNILLWNRAGDRVTADVRGWPLLNLLEAIAAQSGWQVRVEPDLEQPASVKFKNLPYGEALRLLLGDLNYAVVPQTNGPSRFYVFRTALDRATQLVGAADQTVATQPRRVPNELIVRVKPGTDIAALAKSLGAKVVGSIPEMNAYRLQFDDEEATEAARKKLQANPEVASVQDNYYVDQPHAPQNFGGPAAPEIKLTLDPPKQDDCKVVIGLVDSRLQNLGPQMETFIKERISVAGGQSTADDSQPTHATAMAIAILQAMQASGRSSTSVPIIPVDVFGAETSANTFNVALGMITAANKGATIINASLGGYGNSPILSDTTKLLASKNIPVFAAVGNDASNKPFYPAADPYVTAITASERGRLAAYANVGTAATIAAPGTVLFSYNSQTYGSQGTSVSTAVATGVAAGIADANCAPWSQVIPLLQKNMPVPGK